MKLRGKVLICLILLVFSLFLLSSCQPGEKAVAGKAYTIQGCTGVTDCRSYGDGVHVTCEAGYCKSTSTGYCTDSDLDCASGTFCFTDRLCYTKGGETSTCLRDEHCLGENMLCFNTQCQRDTDKDGIVDPNDNCPLVVNADQADSDGDSIGDACQNDHDGDGVADYVVGGDGSLQMNDNCPSVANPSQANSDGDGIGDACDNCPMVSQTYQSDADADGIGDACDDDDNDGIVNGLDNCPSVANPSQANSDGDAVGDACDLCPLVSENYQSDADGDGIGNACDDDKDNDSIVNGLDNCPSVANAGQKNTDGDSEGNACDADDDNDGVADSGDIDKLNPDVCIDSDGDNCNDCSVGTDGFGPLADNLPGNDGSDTDSDGLCNGGDPDDDNDGRADGLDNCPSVSNPGQADADADSIGDACDLDDDNDLVNDVNDNCPLVANADQTDTDNDCPENLDGTQLCGDVCEDQGIIGVGGSSGSGPADADGDGVPDDVDNCLLISNSEQLDMDNDDIGDGCDAPECGNGWAEAGEQCDDGKQCSDGTICSTNNDCNDGSSCTTQNGDGCSSSCMAEGEAGGEVDPCTGVLCPENQACQEGTCVADFCPDDPAKSGPGACGCGVADTDADSDGDADCADGCPNDNGKSDPGVCGCGIADNDIDADAVPDCIDDCPNDFSKSISALDNFCGGLGAVCTDSSECVSNTCVEGECGHPLDVLQSELSALLDEFQNPDNDIGDKVTIIAKVKVVLDKYFEKPYTGPRLR